MLCVASGPLIYYWAGDEVFFSPTIILTPTIHPYRVKGAFGATLMLPIIHPDGVRKTFGATMMRLIVATYIKISSQ